MTQPGTYWVCQKVIGLDQEDFGLDQEYFSFDQEDLGLDQEVLGQSYCCCSNELLNCWKCSLIYLLITWNKCCIYNWTNYLGDALLPQTNLTLSKEPFCCKSLVKPRNIQSKQELIGLNQELTGLNQELTGLNQELNGLNQELTG